MRAIIFSILLAVTANAFSQTAPKTANSPKEFIPSGYVIFEEIRGDLNKDNQEDYVFIIKNTNKDNIVIDKDHGQIDRNPRGIIIAIKNNDLYELALENRHCFTSENEDGGVYYAPELGVNIEKGNLIFHYAHGRYGHWSYKFRYQNSDFELIGFDITDMLHGIKSRITSINFLTKKMLEKINVDQDADVGKEKFKEKWTSFSLSKPIKLSNIDLLDNLDVERLLIQNK